MRRFYIIGFVVLVAFDTLAQVLFKMAALAAAPFVANTAWLVRVVNEPWAYAALACYLGAFVTWMTLLVRAPIGSAYAASHLEVVTVLALSGVLFHEMVSLAQIAGCVLIVLGIAFLAKSADHSHGVRRD